MGDTGAGITVFEWNEDFTYEPHYHCLLQQKHSSLTILLKNKKRYTIRRLVNAPVLYGT